MSTLNIFVVMVATFITVFLESTFVGFRSLIGAQPDFLPALVVYGALTSGLSLATLVSVFGGLWFDALSRNPLGISILPLFITGLVIERYRGLILRDQTYAQFITGFCASAAVPVLTLILLLNSSRTPLVGWSSLWQWIVVSVMGGLATPACFRLFGWAASMLSYESMPEQGSQSNREIKRGRS